MKESGVVIKNDGEYIDVKMSPSGACESCGACFMDPSKLQTLHLKQTVSAQPGERVDVEVLPTFALKSAFLLFFLPLVMLILGYFFVESVMHLPGMNPVYQGIMGGISAMFLTYLAVHYYDKKLQQGEPGKQVKIVTQ